MEVTLPLQTGFRADAPRVSKHKPTPLRVSVSLFAVLVLGAFVLVIYTWPQIHSGTAPATAASLRNLAYLHAVEAGFLILAAFTFASIMLPLTRALKNNSETIGKLTAEIAQSGKQLEQTKGELKDANSRIEHIAFQLQNANVQFDIITSELDAAKRETDAIFATVKQGLFLLNPDGAIGAQTSGELKAIFQTNELARRNLYQLLRPLLPEKRHQTIADYLELIFDPRKNEKQLQRFNPLKRIELNFSSPEGGFQSKHVEFSFQRIVRNNTVTRVMVTALDITGRVKLEDKLREGEVLREKQLELLFDLLQVDNEQLRGFLGEASGGLEKINAIFMEPCAGTADQLQDKVQRVFRVAHNLKSHSASLGLHLFEKTIHQIEERLNELRRNSAVVNEDLLTVLVSIANLQAQLQDATALIEKISGLRRSFVSAREELLGSAAVSRASLPVQPSAELVRSVEELARAVAARCGKQVRIEWRLSGNFDGLPLRQRRLLQNALFQLVRNSIVHGIEPPEARAHAGKAPCGCISIKLSKLPGENRVLLVCRDDGMGLDAAAIRNRAVREKLIPEDIQLSENELYALIFAPGFSTMDSATEDGGRGVGLDMVRAEVVEELQGEIQIGFSAGKYCEFGIIVPSV